MVFCHIRARVIVAPKRSFGQDNVFAPVCDSFCSQGVVLSKGGTVKGGSVNGGSVKMGL